MPVTIKQIAEHLGVSAVTVSKGLNNTGKLSPRTRKCVLHAATRLGYRPNAAARAMVSGRFKQIGLVLGVDVNRSHIPNDLLFGIHDELAQTDVHLTITRLPDEKLTSEGFVPTILKQIAADGLIINYRSGFPESLIELIRSNAIPSIWIESAQPSDGVDIDHLDAARQLTRHLVELGHKRIAYADHYPEKLAATDNAPRLHPSVLQRREGYATVMREARLTPRMIHRPLTAPKPDRFETAKAWLAAPDRPTAVVAYVPAVAWPIIMAAQSLGLRVPEDISVATFNDSGGVGYPLTEMRLPEYEIGKTAVRMLLEKIEKPRRVLRSARHGATLVKGRSSGPAPQP